MSKAEEIAERRGKFYLKLKDAGWDIKTKEASQELKDYSSLAIARDRVSWIEKEMEKIAKEAKGQQTDWIKDKMRERYIKLKQELKGLK